MAKKAKMIAAKQAKQAGGKPAQSKYELKRTGGGLTPDQRARMDWEGNG